VAIRTITDEDKVTQLQVRMMSSFGNFVEASFAA